MDTNFTLKVLTNLGEKKDNEVIREDGILVTIPKFRDEVEYDFAFYDTYGFGTLSPYNDDDVLVTAPYLIKMVYPSLEEVLKYYEKCDYIIQYRGLYDIKKEDIHFGDIAMALGEVCLKF